MTRTSLLWVTVALVVAASSACEAPAPSANSNPNQPDADPAPTVEAPAASTQGQAARLSPTAESLPDVVDRALPSVVGISTKRTVRRAPPSPFGSPFFNPFAPPGQPQDQLQEGMGSGVIVSENGIILTNNHVVEGADEITVSLHDKRQLDAEVVGTDPQSDIAVVRLLEPPEDLRPLPSGDSDAVRLGETVIAIGNPFGLSSTVTMGIVSAKGRANVGIVDYEDFIQTDAAINPGNSGGALINTRGELVGINTAIVSRTGGYQGIGFAIPSNMAATIKDSLVANGTVTRGWLGVMIQTLEPELAEALGADPKLKGVIVSDTQKESPAAKAGIQRGDIILRVGKRDVTNATQLRNYVAMLAPGDSVPIEIVRSGNRETVQVELGKLGGEGSAVAPITGLEGLKLGKVDPEFRARFRVPDGMDGVAVTDVEPGSPAARIGLRPGDLILEVNRRKLRSPLDFDAAYAATTQKVLFLVYRQGATLFLATAKP